MPSGRPAKYRTPSDMDIRIQEYFTYCDAGTLRKWVDKRGQVHEEVMPIPYTVEDLALYLGFAGRSGLDGYSTSKPEFSDTLSRAKSRITSRVVTGGMLGEFDSKMAQLVARSMDPAYRDKSELALSFSDDISGKLADALAKSAAAKDSNNA